MTSIDKKSVVSNGLSKLSECRLDNGYAFCDTCNIYFIDDILIYGSILCPNGCGYCIRRGMKKEELEYNLHKYNPFEYKDPNPITVTRELLKDDLYTTKILTNPMDKFKCFLGLHLWYLDWSNALKESQTPIPGKAYYAKKVCKRCNKEEI